MFDMDAFRDSLVCRDVAGLRAADDEAVRAERLAHAKHLAIVAELDRRAALGPRFASDHGMSARAARGELDTARRLESLPAVAAAIAGGRLSAEQLSAVVRLADEHSDAEWAERAPTLTPAELARLVRCQEKPTPADSRARREARFLRMWWSDGHTMLHLRGALPDVDGAAFESAIDAMVEKMRPAKGQRWDTRDHRAADALVHLCTRTAPVDDEIPTLAPRPLFVAEVPLSGPATVAGAPIADSLLEQWRANADVEAVVVDAAGLPVGLGRRAPLLSPKLARAILLRDQQCRCGSCDRRHGLQIHHLRPRSCGIL